MTNETRAAARYHRINAEAVELSFRSPAGAVTREAVYREDVLAQGSVRWRVLDIGVMQNWVPSLNPATGLADIGEWQDTGRYALHLQQISVIGEGLAEPVEMIVDGPDSGLFAVSLVNTALEPVSTRRHGNG